MKIRDRLRHVPCAVAATRLLRRGYNRAKFYGQYRRFRRLSGQSPRFVTRWEDRQPCFNDAGHQGFDAHYIQHTAWAARVLREIAPAHHVDISSSLYFVAITSAFIPVAHFDYRPPRLSLSGLQVGSADLTSLPFEDASVESVSCMHDLEHIGLGRYGDPIDPDGDLRAAGELTRVTAPGGQSELY